MRRQLTIGFFFGFLAIALFGCSENNSRDATSPNRPQANMNTRGASPINGIASRQTPAMTSDTEFLFI